MVTTAVLVILGCAAASMLLSWGYFRRYTMTRAPIGVFNLADTVFMMAGIILVPYLYLWLPLEVVTVLLVGGAWSIYYFLLEPVLRGRAAVWLGSGALTVVGLGVAWVFGADGPVFFAVNNALLVLLVIGVTNLWAQSGMRAREVAVLGGFLIVYDFTATTLSPLMLDLLTRLAHQPFAPSLAWPVDEAGGLMGLGLGDLLLAAVFPLVMGKAFGRRAATTAMLLGLGTFITLVLFPPAGIFPVMIVLGPLMIVQYGYWRGRRGPERTTRQYLRAEPLPAGLQH
jgi:hypothetical protein